MKIIDFIKVKVYEIRSKVYSRYIFLLKINIFDREKVSEIRSKVFERIEFSPHGSQSTKATIKEI